METPIWKQIVMLWTISLYFDEIVLEFILGDEDG